MYPNKKNMNPDKVIPLSCGVAGYQIVDCVKLGDKPQQICGPRLAY